MIWKEKVPFTDFTRSGSSARADSNSEKSALDFKDGVVVEAVVVVIETGDTLMFYKEKENRNISKKRVLHNLFDKNQLYFF